MMEMAWQCMFSTTIIASSSTRLIAFEKAVELSNGNLRMHNNLGLAYARLNDFTKAMRAFTAAGGEAQARYNLSQIQSSLDNVSRPEQGYF